MFTVNFSFHGSQLSHIQDCVMSVQMEEITTKLDEAQNLQQSNQQMIQYVAHPFIAVRLFIFFLYLGLSDVRGHIQRIRIFPSQLT